MIELFAFLASFAPIQFLKDGGPFMVPLVICSIVALAIILERGWALRRARVVPEDLARQIMDLRTGGNPNALAAACAQSDSMLARLAQVALQHSRYAKEENIEAVQARGRHEATMLERGLVIIEIVAYIAPLLGLLGTVSGLSHIFAEIGFEHISQQHARFAKGISEILNATIMGLSIAVPAYIAFSYYSRKIEQMVVEVETLCADLLAQLYRQGE